MATLRELYGATTAECRRAMAAKGYELKFYDNGHSVGCGWFPIPWYKKLWQNIGALRDEMSREQVAAELREEVSRLKNALAPTLDMGPDSPIRQLAIGYIPVISTQEQAAILTKPANNTKEALAFAKHKAHALKSTTATVGDTRLTVNLRNDLYVKLRMKALEQKTTAGDLLDQLIEKYL